MRSSTSLVTTRTRCSSTSSSVTWLSWYTTSSSSPLPQTKTVQGKSITLSLFATVSCKGIKPCPDLPSSFKYHSRWKGGSSMFHGDNTFKCVFASTKIQRNNNDTQATRVLTLLMSSGWWPATWRWVSAKIKEQDTKRNVWEYMLGEWIQNIQGKKVERRDPDLQHVGEKRAQQGAEHSVIVLRRTGEHQILHKGPWCSLRNLQFILHSTWSQRFQH